MTATLNIGLNIGDRGLTVEETSALNAILAHTGDNPIAYAVVQSDTEQTLVAVLEEEPTVGELMALCEALEQDCVAILADGDKGRLIGPRAAEWGEFDPEKFIDWPTASVKAARAQVHKTEIAKLAMEREFQAALSEARAAVEKEWSERRSVVSRALSDARSTLIRAENAAAPLHAWEGRGVVMREPKNAGTRWSPKPSETHFDVRRGVVFTFKHGIDLGPGRHYARPGEAFVRLLKKNGAPGLRTEALSKTGSFGAKWELV